MSKSSDVVVIGAGLPRTGTSSLSEALQIIGLGPCHHMSTVFKDSSRSPVFSRAFCGERIDWRSFMSGFPACVDAPTMCFYKELSATFPKAKIVLSVRDSDEIWAKSINLLLVSSGLCGSLYAFNVFLITNLRRQAVVGRQLVDWMCSTYGVDRVDDPRLHSRHNEAVKASVPPEKLLVFNVKEGWEPLCAFLDVPVPDQPFPRVNEAQELVQTIRMIKILGWASWFSLGTVVYFSVKLFRSYLHNK